MLNVNLFFELFHSFVTFVLYHKAIRIQGCKEMAVLIVWTAWTEREIIHLLNRAAFGASPKEIRACLAMGKAETVRRLIAGESLTGEKEALLPIDQVKADGKELKPDQIGDQQVYWLYRMIYTQAPLIEKMALFWHGHFATSYQKVKEIPLMLQQNGLFRKYALGNFRELVLEIGKDPAMMVWLDVNKNRKGKPNENYAREVMELFTLGIGHYTEQDVKEAARAFTGWTYNKDENKVNYQAKQHDDGRKTLLGETGNFGSDDVVEVLFKQDALPQFIAHKLLEEFALINPSEAWINEVARDVASKKTIGEVLGNLFLSDAFYEEKLDKALVKSPAEYVASIMRALVLPMSKGFTQAMRKMGQELYLPPDVAGWRGGTTWLNTTSLLARYQFAESVASKLNGNVLTSTDYTPRDNASAEEWAKLWSKNLGIDNLSPSTLKGLNQYAEDTFMHTSQRNAGLRGLLQLILISPEAQMK
jgi:uncharacterized protein (DUF1800 family)